MLARHAGYPPLDSLEHTVDDLDRLAPLEMALRFGDKLQMLTLVAGGNDEVLHFLIGNG